MAIQSEASDTAIQKGLHGLLPVLARRKAEVARTALAGACASLATVATLSTTAYFTTHALLSADSSLAFSWTVLGSLVVIVATGRWLLTYWGHDLAFALVEHFQLGIFDGLERSAPGYVLGRRSGDLASTATSDAESLEQFYAHLLGDYLGAALTLTVSCIAIAVIDPWVALGLAVVSPFIAVVPIWLAKRAEDREAEAHRHAGRRNAAIVEFVQGLSVIVAFSAGPRHVDYIERSSREAESASASFGRRAGIERLATEALLGLSLAGMLVVVAWRVVAGHLPAGWAPTLVLTTIATMAPLTAAAASGRKLGALRASAQRVLTILHQPDRVAERAEVVDTVSRGGIQFENVSFDYGLGRGEALSGVSFTVPEGQTVALVGASGAGKSTCAHLLLRFWDPSSGSIKLGGVDLRDHSIAALRDAIAWVPQDTHVFNLDISENVRLGRPEASRDEVETALRHARLDALVARLPEGMATVCGERGSRLSGGERQRLAIARAVLKDAPVLVLDEPTASLDLETERAIHQALRRLRAGRTTLLIAHRATTIREADYVVVLDGGRILEQGTYEDLISKDGALAALMRDVR